MTSNTTATLTFTRDPESAWAYPAVSIGPGADAGAELPRRCGGTSRSYRLVGPHATNDDGRKWVPAS